MCSISFKGRHFRREMILQCVRWYLAYGLSYRDLEEIMEERGSSVDHSTIHRWVSHYSPLLLAEFRKRKRNPGTRWRMDETYLKVKGEWKYYYRAVDRDGETVDFLLTSKRDKKSALRFLSKAIGNNGRPSLINIDKSGANTAAIRQYNHDTGKRIKTRQCKYLNNVVEQDHRLVKRITKPMLGFKNFFSAQRTLAGIELIRMIRKCQMRKQAGVSKTPAQLFYGLAD
ncbi:IS6 family transposase [Pseudomaricurvus alkylphenolicus]|uniref:IS6 family transposase n=1 Tax=Pseudomaricurvus alkylphenolicus TaxID=1306991 RepID=UPI00141FE366|nr:IS6 family transposase [Pseudomaricurvus alkylphenolicus]NIB40335.1 IS6 family transposase [Pseudomaricurvus alkylphenolicus]